MIVPKSAPSVLVFELSRKFLLYKILERELAKQLKFDIINSFGVNYVTEKNNQDERRSSKARKKGAEANKSTAKGRSVSSSSEKSDSVVDTSTEDEESHQLDSNLARQDSADNTETDNTLNKVSSRPSTPVKLALTNDLIYEYFSPIVNSFEISREINFQYETLQINRNRYFVRLYLYKNCLTLLIYDVDAQQASLSDSSDTELTRQLYVDFYTNWFNKSLLSLIKFKFGICSDDKCFKSRQNKLELKNLYKKWSEYFLNDQSYFVESIDSLVVNDDIKSKCKHFLDELVGFLHNMESILSEFAHLDKRFSKESKTSDEDDGDMEFMTDNDEDKQSSSKSSKWYNIEEFEKFFNDPTHINQFILTYNGKLLYKYRRINASNRINEKGSSNTFAIDSSSVFMLLLEAAEFLKYTTPELYQSASSDHHQAADPSIIGQSSEDDFETASNSSDSLSAKSVSSSSSSDEPPDESVSQEVKTSGNRTGLNSASSFMESFKSPISQSNYLYDNFETESRSSIETPFKNTSRSSLTSNGTTKFTKTESIASSLNILGSSSKTPASNSIEGIEDTLSLNNLKAVKNFKKTQCFLLNSNKVTVGFYEVLYLKLSENLCLILLKQHKFSKYCELITDFDTLLTDFLELISKKQLKLSDKPPESVTIKPDTRRVSSGSSRLGSFSNLNVSPEEKIEKTFLSFFVNKLIIFYDKLTNLKNDMNSRSSNSQRNSLKTGRGLISKTMSTLKNFNSIDETTLINSFRTLSSKDSVGYEEQNQEEIQTKNVVKFIHSLQVKLNQFTNNNQFKDFVTFVNNNLGDSVPNSSILLSLRQIDTQIGLIQGNLNDLFYELFLTNAVTVSQNLTSDEMKKHTRRRYKKASLKSQLVSDQSLFKSIHLLDVIKSLFNKNLCHYLDYIDIKFKRNISMAFYSHNIPSLVHFTLINRQTNVAVIPSIDPVHSVNLDQTRINLAYRKFMPIILTLLYKNDCTQFKFVDDKLEIVFCYFVWFEDKSFNNIPIDFTETKPTDSSNNEPNNNTGNNQGRNMFETNSFMYRKSKLANIHVDHGKNCSYGITNVSYYDLLKALCYPNAPDDSLTCYELMAIFSSKTERKVIDKQLSFLYNYITRNVKDMI